MNEEGPKSPVALGRLPPHSLPAEQGVLGCLLLSPSECLGDCLDALGADADAFYDLRHRHIFTTLVEMFNGHETIDMLTVQQRLKDKNLLETVGGAAYVSPLPDSVPSAANLGYYADILRNKFTLRKLIQTCTETIYRVYEHEGEVAELLEQFERDALTIRGDDGRHGETDVPATLLELADDCETAAQHQGPRGLLTAFPDFDKLTGGLKPGSLIIVAARPSGGKTSLAMNIVDHVAIGQGKLVGIVSLEMTSKELLHRMACAHARVDSLDAAEGRLAEDPIERLTAAIGAVRKAPLRLCDRGGLTVGQVRVQARRWKRDGLALLVVDYLQLLRPGGRNQSRYEAITEISGDLKALAKELAVPVLCFAQLNRANENEGRPPRMADLRDSGAIEQDADVIALLHRPEDAVGDVHPVEMLVSKVRNGPTGKVGLVFHKRFTRFDSRAATSADAAA
jgi:replicative DNA helicase